MKRNWIKALAISTAIIGTCATTVGAAYAGFSSTQVASQSVGIAGTMKVSIFLNYNIWNVLGTEVYYMHTWLNSDNTKNKGILSSRKITVDVYHSNGSTLATMNMIVFELDRNSIAYDRFIFFRCNPTGLTESNYNTSNLWNQTDTITFDSNTNFYSIDGWHTNNSDPNSKCYYVTNNIYINNNGALQFSR